jgi:S-adenosylmethionine synthetase
MYSFCGQPGYYNTGQRCGIYDKKLIQEYQTWGLNINIFKTEYPKIGSDIQNMKIEDNIEIKGTTALAYIFTNSRKMQRSVKENLANPENH